jgi:hypothetical protein
LRHVRGASLDEFRDSLEEKRRKLRELRARRDARKMERRESVADFRRAAVFADDDDESESAAVAAQQATAAAATATATAAAAAAAAAPRAGDAQEFLYEVHVVWEEPRSGLIKKEVPLGAISVSPHDSLFALRAALADELERLPGRFFFVSRDDLSDNALSLVRVEEEEERRVADVAQRDVIRIFDVSDPRRAATLAALLAASARGSSVASSRTSARKSRA